MRGWGKDTVAFAPFQSPCRIYFNLAKFQKVFAGRTECSQGSHAGCSLPTPNVDAMQKKFCIILIETQVTSNHQ